MAGFKKFEEIQAWQKARSATKRIYEITSDVRFAKDFGLRDQIRRSAISIMANIAEGQGRFSDKEFANFLNMAHGSVAETQPICTLPPIWATSKQSGFSELYELLSEIAKMTMGLMKHLRG